MAYHLAAVKQIPRINRILDRAHHRHRFPMLGIEKIQLAVTDAMFTGAGAAHAECAMDDVVVHALGFGNVGGIVGIDQDGSVKIAVADVAE